MTILPPDPYKVLGVSKDAQIPEIRSAHRKLVLKCHPDKIQDPALKEAKQTEFQQVQQAYELLSNEAEREKYDRRAEVYEHARERERERAKTSAARATSSTPKRESPIFYHVNVKDASPRANTFATSGPYARTPPRSYEDTTSSRMFEEAKRQARKTASYEKEKPSKRDEERRRREADKEWAREREKANEREVREARKARERKEEKERTARDREEREKEKRKEEKKKSHSDREREREKERKSATAEKLRSRQHPIIEESSDALDSSSEEDDVIYEPPPSKTDRKKSSSGRKPEDIEPPSSERTRKLSGNIETAIRYLHRSGGKPPSFMRAQTFTEGSSASYNPMVPTPPPAANAPFAPPPPPVEEPEEMSEDDMARRSAARPSRRMSHDTPRSSREKSSLHKKSSSSRDHQPIIVEVGSPSGRAAPPLSRAHTDSYTRPIPVPGMSRADTWYASTDRERERHERSRSRPTHGYTDSDDSEDDRTRRHRRSRRTQSPDPIPVHAVRYSVDTNGTKSIPIRQKQYHEQMPRGSYKMKGGYAVPNSSARLHRGHTVAYHHEEERAQQHFTGVKYSAQFGEQDIRYSDLPYKGSYRPDVYA
ncbi:hypothetical protein GQX73_g4234 [Xylaria multiplex]|uniref:J domain-containing protein n=1 Tax=Xylaria multiplex TaxID=323545 RepID=A0A7C8IUF2_9PEZI|nr:hypothetical protein GQX73_g4234 [Xylaria multiplex]